MKWILSLALAVSLAANAWLTFRLIDSGTTQTYMGDSIQKNRTALLQCIAVTNDFLASGARREALIEKAKTISGVDVTFSNDGHFWVGPFGMGFDEDGRLISVAEWDTVYEQIKKRVEPIPAQAELPYCK